MQKQGIQGRRGVIECVQKGDHSIATKRAKNSRLKGALNKERDILLLLNDRGVQFVPQLIDTGDGWFSYQRIEADHFQDVRKRTTDQTKRKDLASKLLIAASVLDRAGVIHGELLRPTKNVLVTPQGEIAIIDFERGRLGDDSGKNMKAIGQRMHRVGLIDLPSVKALGTMKREAIRNKLSTQLHGSSQWRLLISVCLAGILIDQGSKWLFYDQAVGASSLLLRPMFNEGVAWSIPVPLSVVVIITVLICAGLGRLIRSKQVNKRGAILLLSGALGNLIDRVALNGVRDFIDFHYWPIFNIADILVCIGAGILIWHEFFEKK